MAPAPVAPRNRTCRSGGYVFRWTDRDLTAARTGASVPVFSVAAALKRKFGKPVPDDVVAYYDVSFAPQSVVGPYLGCQRDDSWQGGAHPSGNESFVTVDVRSPNRPVKLTDRFPPDAVRKALLAGQLFGGADDTEFSFPANLLEDFAFHHVEGDRVAIRFLMPHGSEVYRFRNTQTAVLLPIPPRLKPLFMQAATGKSGALMQSLRRTAHGARPQIDARNARPIREISALKVRRFDNHPGKRDHVPNKAVSLWNGFYDVSGWERSFADLVTTKSAPADPETVAANERITVTGHGHKEDSFGEFAPLRCKIRSGGETWEDTLWRSDVYLNPCRPQRAIGIANDPQPYRKRTEKSATPRHSFTSQLILYRR